MPKSTVKRGYKEFRDSGAAGRWARYYAKKHGYKRNRHLDEYDPYYRSRIQYSWSKGRIYMTKSGNIVSFHRYPK